MYRQEMIFKRLSIDLSRATLSNWVLKSAELLMPFYERLHQHLIRQQILQADETTLNVIQDGREERRNPSPLCGSTFLPRFADLSSYRNSVPWR